MRNKLIALAAAVVAFGAAPAVAAAESGGPGGLQQSIQDAVAKQVSAALSSTQQTPVNGNAPVTISAGGVSSGPSWATQNAEAKAHANSANSAPTTQSGSQQQIVGNAKGCGGGCGGAGGAQLNGQKSDTEQVSAAKAATEQTPVNGNAPVTISAGGVSSGPSSANQNAAAKAKADSANSAPTTQTATQTQAVGGTGSCLAGCGGAGGAQLNGQKSDTEQASAAKAATEQTPVNGNAPVTISAGGVSSGPSSANQNAAAKAKADSANSAPTTQTATQTQAVGGLGSCLAGCGGAGGAQLNGQKSDTEQVSAAKAATEQTPVNGNAPVTISAGGVSSDPSSANQNAAAKAHSDSANSAPTTQGSTQTQAVG
ncbi:MAG TPA: hypothetical protein VF101_16045 [Gaiellaceae bacterium]